MSLALFSLLASAAAWSPGARLPARRCVQRAPPPLRMCDQSAEVLTTPAVAEMLEARDLSFYPILKASSIVFEDQISNESLLQRLDEVHGSTLRELATTQEALQRVEAEQKTAAERLTGGH